MRKRNTTIDDEECSRREQVENADDDFDRKNDATFDEKIAQMHLVAFTAMHLRRNEKRVLT